MERKINKILLAWKNSKQHLPLLLYGARQTGKTYILKQFGKAEFADVVLIDFEKDKRLVPYLDASIEPKRILETIERLYSKHIEPQKTLLIFDEIQACDRALTALKYFAEDAPEYYVAAAGSLLGVKIERDKFSFPVGKVKPVNMYPLDFEEYLYAIGQSLLAENIRECYASFTPLPELLHNEALQLYRQYLVTGGMPAAVVAAIEGRNYQEVQSYLYATYVGDMSKYTTRSESVRIAEAYESLPAQLAKDNKKFQYKLIKTGARSSLYGTSIDWLAQAGIVLKCTRVEQGMIPVVAYQDLSSFKLYYSDTGLFCQHAHLTAELLESPGAKQFSGILAENYVAVTLRASGHELNYWTSSSEAEVDFIITTAEGVIPIECKADVHVRSRSLQAFCKKYQPPYAIRISARNFGFENGIKSVPLYAAFCV